MVEEDYERDAAALASKAERKQKQRTREARKAKEEMDRKEEPRGKLLRLHSRK